MFHASSLNVTLNTSYILREPKITYSLLAQANVFKMSLHGLIAFSFSAKKVEISTALKFMYGTGYKSEYKNRGSITYSTDQENKLSEIFIISLGSNREERFQFK